MLQIVVPATELWDEQKQEFIMTKEQELRLEHSLVSISKWESKWHKVFLSEKEEKSTEEIIDYVRCMTLTQNVDPLIYLCLSKENMDAINSYISDPMTATFVNEPDGKPSREPVTSELIYYWMISLNIPFECQKWHINRLITLIKVCGHKNSPPRKMSKRQIMERNNRLNNIRRAKLGTKG